MDTLTHALSGALLARAVPATGAARQVPTAQRLLLGFGAAAFPDADIALSLISPLAHVTLHRGVTHSLIMLPLWALAIAWLAAWVFRHPAGWRAYWGVAALGIGVHILGDLITSFGTMILAPLSDRRFGWGTTFVIDLWISGLIVSGLAASRLARPSLRPAQLACALVAAYVCGQALLKQQAADFGRAQAEAMGIAAATVSALPRPPYPTHWTVVIDDGERYRYAHVSLARREPRLLQDGAGFISRVDAAFAPTARARWHEGSRFGTGVDAALAREAWRERSFGFFRRFAAMPTLLAVEQGNPYACVWFQDLRFEMPERANPFRYGLCREAGGRWRRFERAGGGARPLD